MSINLKLSHKGLILVGILLFMELVFVGALSALLNRAEQEALREAHSKEIVGKTNHVMQLAYDAGEAASDYQMHDGGAKAAKNFHDACAKIPVEIAKLKEAVKDDPLYLKRVTDIDAGLSKCIRIVAYVMNLAEQGRKLEAVGVMDRVRPVFHKTEDEMFTGMRELMAEQEKILAESPTNQARDRGIVKALLLTGVTLNVVFAIAISLFFLKTITRRIDMMVDNTARLVKHEQLHESLPGTDEIAHLDHAFHDMAKKLREVEEMKQQFVSMVSHDLRTPLTSVAGVMEMLAGGAYGELSDTGVKRVDLARRNVSRLIALINDLLDVDKLESGRFELALQKISLEPVVTKSIEAVRVFAEQHKVNLQAEPMDFFVYADGDRLAQVLINLISNAVKFSPEDSTITISAAPVDDLVEIRVADQGRGIPPQFLETIFDRFSQVTVTDATKKGGSGLGLAICKAIVEQHAGNIGVESEEGKGSTFWFRIPANEPAVTMKMEKYSVKQT